MRRSLAQLFRNNNNSCLEWQKTLYQESFLVISDIQTRLWLFNILSIIYEKNLSSYGDFCSSKYLICWGYRRSFEANLTCTLSRSRNWMTDIFLSTCARVYRDFLLNPAALKKIWTEYSSSMVMDSSCEYISPCDNCETASLAHCYRIARWICTSCWPYYQSSNSHIYLS